MNKRKILMLTHSAGFKHDYLPVAVKTIEELGAESKEFEVVATEDCSLINEENLKTISALLFATTGELPMKEEQKAALIRFVKEGGGFVGVHNATDTFYKFPEYGEMLGGYFNGHPWTQEIVAKVEDNNHPATKHLPKSFKVKEEVYTFKNWSRNKTHVLISLDTSSVDLSRGNRVDNDYALSWCHEYGKGRVFYTAFGHFKEIWNEEWFRKHLLGGILWSMNIL
ncbi:ThuA domain-containing protein [archaeon]|nr:ThuA domain-containing protein [archaeon]NHV06500.1 ThuA domain-containing protein [Nitrososphaerota archaeon]